MRYRQSAMNNLMLAPYTVHHTQPPVFIKGVEPISVSVKKAFLRPPMTFSTNCLIKNKNFYL